MLQVGGRQPGAGGVGGHVRLQLFGHPRQLRPVLIPARLLLHSTHMLPLLPLLLLLLVLLLLLDRSCRSRLLLLLPRIVAHGCCRRLQLFPHGNLAQRNARGEQRCVPAVAGVGALKAAGKVLKDRLCEASTGAPLAVPLAARVGRRVHMHHAVPGGCLRDVGGQGSTT